MNKHKFWFVCHNPQGCIKVFFIFECFHEGLPRDQELALQLYESSAEGGNQEARAEVRRLQQLLEEEAEETEVENGELASSGGLAILFSKYFRVVEFKYSYFKIVLIQLITKPS